MNQMALLKYLQSNDVETLRLLKAFGIDTENVTKVVITCEVGNPVQLLIEKWVQHKNIQPFTSVKKYMLIEEDKPKHEVFSRPECIFQYCPTPEKCKAEGKCVNIHREKDSKNK